MNLFQINIIFSATYQLLLQYETSDRKHYQYRVQETEGDPLSQAHPHLY